jgi:hypothetical protein
MYFLTVGAGVRMPASGGPLLSSQTYIKSWTVTIRRHSLEVSFPEFSNNSEHQISTKCFAPAHMNQISAKSSLSFSVPPATCRDATLHGTA